MTSDATTSGDAGATPPLDLLIRGGLVVTMNPRREVYRDGYVAVQGGRIVAVGRDAECPYGAADATELLDARERVVLPGFVNTHDHLLAAFARGLGADRAV
ncbi:MAG: hypothetical protein O3C25_01900, partial [Chloroflexi bacterium]|nr:hypothetical protein [Chloroflexota bacterium]